MFVGNKCVYVHVEKNGSGSGALSTFERFVTGTRIIEAMKWACANMPAVEEQDVGRLAPP